MKNNYSKKCVRKTRIYKRGSEEVTSLCKVETEFIMWSLLSNARKEGQP